jgi:TonB-linked SusC/RagA family outer membrane protein
MAAMLLLVSAWAQRTVSGRVTDDKGAPVANASVTVRGTTTGTVTAADGSFSLSVPANARILVISSIGMATQEISITNQTSVNVSLQAAAASSMEEVVVVGYGTQRRRDVTAAISSVGAEKIKDLPVQSFEQALAGKATGLNITIPNGVLNNPPVVRIRGANSITGSTFPLVVVDGVPVFTGDISTNNSANNVLGNINPSDIESVEVLKDAAATAIYGSRAANGVLLITTKKGRAGRARVTYEAWAGWTKPFNLFEVLNAQQYVTMKNEGLANLNAVVVSGVPAGAPLFFMDTINGRPVDTRWNDYVYQTGTQHNHSLSVSGANQGTNYYLSANYTKQDGMLITNKFERKQIRMNIGQRVSEWLKVGANFNFSRGATQSPSTGSLPGTPFATAGSARLAFVTAPNVSPYLADGRYNIFGIDNPTSRNSFNQIGRNKNLDRSGFYNPVAVRDLNSYTSESDQLLGDVHAEVRILKGLTFRTQYGVNWQRVEDKTFLNSLHGDGIQQATTTADDGNAFNVAGKYNITNLQNYLTYDFSLNNTHNFNILAGSEEQQTNIDRWGASRSGLTDQFFNEFQGNFTINDNPIGNLITENYLLSFFGRVNYNYKNRYYLSGNVRRDGYSAFAEGKKWGTFGGGSIGWNISEEDFWKSSNISRTVSALKLRASYGYMGNITSVGNFAALSTYSSFQYGLGYPTLFFSQAGNQDLTWEKSNKFDVGLSAELFNGRLIADIGYYNTSLSDLIINVPTPPSMGIPGNSIAANAATMYNRGFEVGLTGRIFQNRDFTWSTTLNVTTQKNEVTSLAPGVPEILGISQLERTNITRVGQPIGSFFVVRTGGVDEQTGRRIFIDKDGKEVLFNFADPVASRWRYRDGTIARPIDLGIDGQIAGNALPTVYGGFRNDFAFKGFDLTLDAIYSYGNKVYFGSRAGLLDQRFWNNSTEVLNRWQRPGDKTNIPRVVYNDNISNGSSFPLDVNLFDGGFFRMRSIVLGYTLPTSIVERMRISSFRIYTQVLNAFIITKYPGIDPEISVNGNSALTPSVDRNTIGQARTFTLGINVGF